MKPMNAREAKDFLVEQVAEQARLDNVSLSQIEKRMMYFVENDPTSCEDPFGLNVEFEAQCDTPEYENKISGLLSRAYKRLKTEDPEKVSQWDDALRTLYAGDHYLPVMWHGRHPQQSQARRKSKRTPIPGPPPMADYTYRRVYNISLMLAKIFQALFEATKGVFRPGPDDPKTFYGRVFRFMGLICVYALIAAIVAMAIHDLATANR
jgi:hypothetical protein